MAKIDDINKRHTEQIDSMMASFERELRIVITKANGDIAASLQENLTMTDGVIDGSKSNNRIIRNLAKQYQKALDAAGYPALVESLSESFSIQLPVLQDTIKFLSDQMDTPLKPMRFTQADLDVLSTFQVNAGTTLQSVMDSATSQAMTQGLFSVGGLKFKDLVDVLAEKLELSIPRSVSIADTAMTTWYRTAADLQFQHIEEDLPQMKIRYEYGGPVDIKIRPFCGALMAANKNYSRDQINKMDNDQLPNVFLTCGGYNCRHVWLMAI